MPTEILSLFTDLNKKQDGRSLKFSARPHFKQQRQKKSVFSIPVLRLQDKKTVFRNFFPNNLHNFDNLFT